MLSAVRLFLDPTGLIVFHLSLTVNHGEFGMAKIKLRTLENMDTHGTLIHASVICLRFQFRR